MRTDGMSKILDFRAPRKCHAFSLKQIFIYFSDKAFSCENYIKADILWLIYEPRHDSYIKKGIRWHERDNRDTSKLWYHETDFGEWKEHFQRQNKKTKSLINMMSPYRFYNYLLVIVINSINHPDVRAKPATPFSAQFSMQRMRAYFCSWR